MAESTPGAPGPIVLWLSSRYENIELGQAALAHVCRQRGIDTEMEHWIGMALREAVANAIKHGNRQDPVQARHALARRGTANEPRRSSSATRARGSTRQRVSDPLAPENQMKTSGRGIFYMRTFMDDVTLLARRGRRHDPHDDERTSESRNTKKGAQTR